MRPFGVIGSTSLSTISASISVCAFTARGVTIAAGDRLALVYPSANRDEEVFDDPFRFDVTRSPNPHIAFGYGTHFCIGANVARHELHLLLAKLTRDWTNLRAVTEPDVEPNHFARAVRSFELAFDPRNTDSQDTAAST